MARHTRSVGYCTNVRCDDYGKGVFLLNHGDTFNCPDCRYEGRQEKERGAVSGPATGIFKSVRVEYNYESDLDRYRDAAIVRDDSIWDDGQTYTLYSPLVRTEKRALKVAEAILCSLNQAGGQVNLETEIPTATETILKFDEDFNTVAADCQRLGRLWEGSPLLRRV